VIQPAAPLGYGLALEQLESAQAELGHPLRLALDKRNLLDYLLVQPLARLEEVVFGHREAVAIAVVQSYVNLLGVCCHYVSSNLPVAWVLCVPVTRFECFRAHPVVCYAFCCACFDTL